MTRISSMPKLLALDIGDVWTGSALSDTSYLIAQPYKTVQTAQLVPFLQETISIHQVKEIIVGYPQTLRGTESEQTKKILACKDTLEQQFPAINWILWDERLSSKQAATKINTKNPQERQRAHSIAAAYILSTYLEFRTNRNW